MENTYIILICAPTFRIKSFYEWKKMKEKNIYYYLPMLKMQRINGNLILWHKYTYKSALFYFCFNVYSQVHSMLKLEKRQFYRRSQWIFFSNHGSKLSTFRKNIFSEDTGFWSPFSLTVYAWAGRNSFFLNSNISSRILFIQ